jgi:hypothetical protein
MLSLASDFYIPEADMAKGKIQSSSDGLKMGLKVGKLQVQQLNQMYTNTDCYLSLSALGS